MKKINIGNEGGTGMENIPLPFWSRCCVMTQTRTNDLDFLPNDSQNRCNSISTSTRQYSQILIQGHECKIFRNEWFSILWGLGFGLFSLNRAVWLMTFWCLWYNFAMRLCVINACKLHSTFHPASTICAETVQMIFTREVLIELNGVRSTLH